MRLFENTVFERSYVSCAGNLKQSTPFRQQNRAVTGQIKGRLPRVFLKMLARALCADTLETDKGVPENPERGQSSSMIQMLALKNWR